MSVNLKMKQASKVLNNATGPRLYPKLDNLDEIRTNDDLYTMGTLNNSIMTVRNDLGEKHTTPDLYPNLEEEFPEYFPPDTAICKIKITNELHGEGLKSNENLKRELEDRIWNDCSRTCNVCEERKIRKCQRWHKRLRRGYKFLAFTIGLPFTLLYLAVRTSPGQASEINTKDEFDEFDAMASATAKLLRIRRKSTR